MGWHVGQVGMEPSGVNTLWLPGSTGQYVSTPYSAANTITGDIDIRILVKTPATRPSTAWALMAHWRPSPFSNRGFIFMLRPVTAPNWQLAFYASTTGTNNPSAGSNSFPETDLPSTDPRWFRVTRVAATAIAAFYTSADGITWTGIGGGLMTDSFGASPTGPIYGSGTTLTVGGYDDGSADPFEGNVYKAELRDGIGGMVVQSFDATAVAPTGLRTPGTVAAGGPWTINGVPTPAWEWQAA